MITRRNLLKLGLAGAVSVALGHAAHAVAGVVAERGPVMKAIPSSGERLPVIGIGTARKLGITSISAPEARWSFTS